MTAAEQPHDTNPEEGQSGEGQPEEGQRGEGQRGEGQRGNVVVRVLHWLQVGYPEGVPRQDRFALIALLQRRLTEEQTREVVADLTSATARAGRDGDPITADEIAELVARQLREDATPADVTRVSARLAAGGWPLADPFTS